MSLKLRDSQRAGAFDSQNRVSGICADYFIGRKCDF